MFKNRTSRRQRTFERLENRLAMAVYIVSNGNDSGAGSLRNALLEASASTDVADEIRFAPAVNIVTLTTGELVSNAAATTTLFASGVTIQRLSTAPAFRLLSTSGSLVINGGRFTGGRLTTPGAGGAGILNTGSLKLDSVTVDNNINAGRELVTQGGGISSVGILSGLELVRSTVTNNRVNHTGGGIYAFGILEIVDSEITNNVAVVGNGGGIATGVETKIVGSNISGNRADSKGGGLFTIGTDTPDGVTGPNISIEGSTLNNNIATDGGAIYVLSSLSMDLTQISNNQASRIGGGLYAELDSTVRVNDSSVSDNRAVSGGGIFNNGTLTVERSTLARNRAIGGSGGGLLSARSSFEDQPNVVVEANISNSTISGNIATSAGGGMSAEGNFSLVNSTVAFNRAGRAAGLQAFARSAFLVNSIVGLNRDSNGVLFDIQGTVSFPIYNLISDATNSGGIVDGQNGNQVGVNPRIGPLRFNGDLVELHPLLPNSPALNSALPASNTGETDQRGAPRNRFGRADIGSYELQPSVSKSGRTYTYTDYDQAVNDLKLEATIDGKLRLSDAKAPLIDSSGIVRPALILDVGVNDRVVLKTQDGNDQIYVNLQKPLPNFSRNISIQAGRGKDTLIVAGDANYRLADNSLLVTGTVSAELPLSSVERAILSGGASANRMDGKLFSGELVLEGGDANDVLIGGSGPNILIGGRGLDRLIGGQRSDLLIGGRTTFSVFNPGFSSIIDVWTSNEAYSRRVQNLRTGNGLSNGLKLTTFSVPNDNERDYLEGGSAVDYFWAYSGDFLADRLANEIVDGQ